MKDFATTALIILDGWGIGRKDTTNPIHEAKLTTLPKLALEYPYGALQASGIAVGLPWDGEGTSETGHLTIGAGRTIWQRVARVDQAIENSSFFKNRILQDAVHASLRHRGTVHIAGLISEHPNHASYKHIAPLILLARNEGAKHIYLHLWSDGEDSAPHSFASLIKKLPQEEDVIIASLSGRYYAMAKENINKRMEATRASLTGKAPKTTLAHALETLAAHNLNDAFLEPGTINQEGAVQPGDTLIFFNNKEIPIMKGWEDVRVTSFVEAFPEEPITHTLGETLAENNLFQMRVAETPRYEHITRLINCFKETPFEREYRVLLPSRQEARPETHPDMMTAEIANRTIAAIEEGIQCVISNIASPDTIAHTGDFTAALQAARAVDAAIERIAHTAIAKNTLLIITGSHSNFERMRNPRTGTPETDHNTNPVPIWIVHPKLKHPKTERDAAQQEAGPQGTLADVAPTLLTALNITPPHEMTGADLLYRLS